MFYAAFVLVVGLATRISTAGAQTIIAANVLWTIASFVLLFSGMVQPTALGSFGRLGWTTWMGSDEPPQPGAVRGECIFHPAERAAHDRRSRNITSTTGNP